MIKTKLLCVLDGFGLTTKSPNNAAYLAKMPNFRQALQNYYWTTLDADGEWVGQESGLVGNSEVGHMNIGGLQLVKQLSYQVTESAKNAFDLNSDITPQQIFDPKKLLTKIWQSEHQSKTVHLVGLFSTGTIHSDLRHWTGAIESAGKAGAEKIVLHLVTDGRDSDRQSLVATWDSFISNNHDLLDPYSSKIYLGSVGGRFYTMDRDKNWDRVAVGISAIFDFSSQNTEKLNHLLQQYNLKASDLTVKKHDSSVSNNFDNAENLIQEITQNNYALNQFDETIHPQHIKDGIHNNEVVWLLNFRADRMKQVSQFFCDLNLGLDLGLTILTMNDYDNGKAKVLDQDFSDFIQSSKSNFYPVFKNKPVENTLAETISKLNKTQLHIAETEKYNHVTYFLNGGQTKKSAGEDWVVIDSNKVASHAEKPEMKAGEITDYILKCLEIKVDILPYSSDFKDTISKIVREALTDVLESPDQIPKNIFEATLKKIYPFIFDGGQEMFESEKMIIKLNDEIVGFVAFDYKYDPDKFFIYDLYIDRDFRSQGIGDYVLNWLTNYAKRLNKSLVSLWVDVSNPRAQKFYLKKGFENQSDQFMRWYDESGNVAMETESYIFDLDLSKIPVFPQKYDFIIVNYANPDMVGHTGDIPASIISMEFLDNQLGRLFSSCQEQGHKMLITADHGNIELVGEYEINGKVLTDTEHNPNPVPCLIIDSDFNPETLLKNISQSSHQFNINSDEVLLAEVLSEKNQVDISDQQNWLEKSEIPTPKLPLWYAGLIALDL
jgi:2,3-bisphosphoglycerate-independent phosphoglycerate mutase